MAQNTYKQNTARKPKNQDKPSPQTESKAKFNFWNDRRLQLVVGFALIGFSLFAFLAMVSYIFTGEQDQSLLVSSYPSDSKQEGAEIKNWLGILGARLSSWMVYSTFGFSSILLIPIIFGWGFKLVFQKSPFSLSRYSIFGVFFTLWLSVLFGILALHLNLLDNFEFLYGSIGFILAEYTSAFLGWGAFLLLAVLMLGFVIFYYNISSIASASTKQDELTKTIPFAAEELDADIEETGDLEEELEELDVEGSEDSNKWVIKDLGGKAENQEAESTPKNHKPEFTVQGATQEVEDNDLFPEDPLMDEEEDSAELSINPLKDEPVGDVNVNYDPTLDLPSYKYPPLDLLKEYDNKVQVSKAELEANMENIVKTLGNYNIEIAKIEATIGPTVTLYEIIPAAGVRISKIKGLVDDIALNLAALGIRIIAPMPGKGTIGIEVPNKNREMVSMRSMLSTEKFLKTDKELPIILGKTISNEVFIADLSKMPHLLIAGATGQGKSVGLNVILTSLIYKKHPSQLKFVLVDPKKVELTLFNKIEKHFLAQLPGSEEAIITDTKKVVNTLNSLCIEMDERYNLLKDAGCRSIKEYNAKFVERRLNPNKGHRFLPFIVLVIDELADLMMTAGKEVETPIARLAQLARAIGIHLVVATQRPSVNVITGIIKANFPVRLSFRVSSKIDSRTILDTGGAEQLVGQGDMLLSQGSDLIRIQCAFVDTPEVDRVCDFIGAQRGYDTAYQLPEFYSEEEEGIADFDFSERDPMFEEAARMIVLHQQGSTSLLQRKMKLGYNRAGRLMDQLEAAGIVGPSEGSKAREVLMPDDYNLEQLLNSLKNK